jgi:serine protease AprX
MNKLYKPFHILMVLVLVFSLIAPAALTFSTTTARMQPLLAEMAAEQPERMVRVIIQKADATDRAERLLEKLGGNYLKELRLINAFAAELPAKTVPHLAKLAAVSWVSLDGAVESAGGKPPKDDGSSGTTTNTYLDTLGVRDVWAMGYDGQGIGIAVIDSGAQHSDLDANVVVVQPFNVHSNINDYAGHGTHVAGIMVGSGAGSRGDYAGVAPGASLIALNVSEYDGMSYESDSVAAMQWVYDNKDVYNIRVVNLSINSTVASSYHQSPMDAAAEILWFNGIVVVASAGNSGTSDPIDTITAAPANDPFIITVGATDEQGTTHKQDDSIPPFSASGMTLEGYWKPDIYAPGVEIISTLADMSMWDYLYSERKITTRTAGKDYEYFRASGTSMAAPMVAGAAALLLEAEPDLTPDQVKFRLTWAGTVINGDAYLDVYEALTTPTTEAANQGLVPHMLLAKMAMIAYWSSENGGENIDWENIDWAAVNWNAVNWNAVNWNAVNWNAVNWNAVNWNAVNWNAVNWNAVSWNAVNWNAVSWNAVNWNAVNWNAVNWNSVSFEN